MAIEERLLRPLFTAWEGIAQRLRQRCGGRAQSDKVYERQRARCPYLARAKAIRSGARWRKKSEACRRRHPLCAACKAKGRTTEATEVDHIIRLVTLLKQQFGGAPPHIIAKRTPMGAFDDANLPSLCRTCHNQKSALERVTGDAIF